MSISTIRSRVMVLLVVCALLLAAVAIKRPKRVAFRYEGRTAGEWLRSAEFETNKAHVAAALFDLGEKATPEIHAMFRSGSRIERLMFRATPKRAQRWWLSWHLYEDRERAVEAVTMVGPAAVLSFPDLLYM